MRQKIPKPIWALILAVASVAAWVQPGHAYAQLVEIIHTNDLHSHLDRSDLDGLGGYAAVKATIDSLKDQADQERIPTLILDAGDFSEGSKYYLADGGEQVWRVMDAMGYDAVTIGNHDWLMGAAALDRMAGKIRPSFAFLGANFIFSPERKNLTRYLKPSADFVRGGVRIGVLGLTVDEWIYDWIARDAFIFPPVLEARKDLPGLRARNDFVIGLTHLGVKTDISLIQQTRGFDLIVGGHSHTRLERPVYIPDRGGTEVPIVQTGAYGEAVGDLLVDLEPGKKLQILRYRLVPVLRSGPQDPEILKYVDQARERLEADYGAPWLYEVIGKSEVPLERQITEPTAWSQLLADSLRESTHSDLSIDIPDFTGLNQPAGPITREQLIELYPRMLNTRHKLGWTVWTAQVRGGILHKALQEAFQNEYVFSTSGVTYETVEDHGVRKVRNIRIGGRKIRWWKSYRVALPEGIGRGAKEISPVLRVLVQHPRDSGIPIWSAVEQKIRGLGVIRPRRLR